MVGEFSETLGKISNSYEYSFSLQRSTKIR